MQNNVGLWLIGARGSVATTMLVGLGELAKTDQDIQNVGKIGLISELPQFSSIDLVPWNSVTVGGHEIRETNLLREAEILAEKSRAFETHLVAKNSSFLSDVDNRIRPGILSGCGNIVESLATDGYARTANGNDNIELIELIKTDLDEFKKKENLDSVVVVNVASTEPTFNTDSLPTDWNEFESNLNVNEFQLPSSTLYAIAAFQSGMPFVNFTPSIGSNLPALKDLALTQGVCHCGQDGKTGETLVKSALAPMFAHRNLNVMSWVGHNIFGNMDAKVLDEPENKQSKVSSKDQLLQQILGYQPQTHISIENINSLGDWKTAWDHVHFQGFLGTPMTLQFVWQGCDSILAAPLVLDLVRFAERAQRAEQHGVLEFLSSFFKSPMSIDGNQQSSQELTAQFQQLEQWAEAIA